MKIAFARDFYARFKRCFRSSWHPAEIWYRLQCWAWHRYTTVKPRTLDHTWCDCSHLLPHVMFELLGRFIENECSPGCADWYGKGAPKIDVDGCSTFVRDEMSELWNWWCNDYIIRYDKRRDEIWAAIDKIDDASLGTNSRYPPEAAAQVTALYASKRALDVEMREGLQSRLHRLINIREYMWT